MRNYDELILRQKRLDPNAPFPLEHQAVRMALFDEYAARSFYLRVSEAYGQRPPFPNIIRSEERHIAALSSLCDRLGIAKPLDPFPYETSIEPTWLANCARAVTGEVENIRLYTQLLAQVSSPDIRRVFSNLQAASYEHHLPAFRDALLQAANQERYHATQGVPAQQAYIRHGPLSDIAERILSQVSGQGGLVRLFSPMVRQAHPALLAGLVVGGTGAYLIKTKCICKK